MNCAQQQHDHQKVFIESFHLSGFVGQFRIQKFSWFSQVANRNRNLSQLVSLSLAARIDCPVRITQKTQLKEIVKARKEIQPEAAVKLIDDGIEFLKSAKQAVKHLFGKIHAQSCKSALFGTAFVTLSVNNISYNVLCLFFGCLLSSLNERKAFLFSQLWLAEI